MVALKWLIRNTCFGEKAVPVVYAQCCVGGPGGLFIFGGSGGSVGLGEDPTLGVSSNLGGLVSSWWDFGQFLESQFLLL